MITTPKRCITQLVFPRNQATMFEAKVSSEPNEEGLDHTAKVPGSDLIVLALHYPHGDCDFPHSVTKFKKRTDISKELKEKILWKNPACL